MQKLDKVGKLLLDIKVKVFIQNLQLSPCYYGIILILPTQQLWMRAE